VPRPPTDAEPKKLLAASGDHPLTPEAAPAVEHLATSHSSPSPSDAAGEARARAPTSGSVMPRASLADTTAILTRGQTAFDRGDYQEAIRQGRQAIVAGAEINGRLLVGDVYFYLERYREALREYNAAVARDPSDASARKRRDLAREKAGQAAQGDAP
jgi:tetratricopeptide (TPR) repeat protein